MKTSFGLPTDIEPLTRHPKATPPGEKISLHHSMCYGCGDEAPIGLRIAVTAGEGVTSTATMRVEDWMQGGPGVIHGGVLSGAFDEVMGTTPLLLRKPVVTGHLAVDYAKPIPLGSTVYFACEIVGGKGRRIYTRATAHLGDPESPVAGAHALFIEIDLEKHFAGYREKAVHAGARRQS